MRLTVDVFRYCNERLPRFNTISISGYHIREAGSSAAQELGFTLANGIAYVEAALAAGLAVDVFAPRLSFFFNAHNDVFVEVAKFRAARRIWATLMRERFGARDERSLDAALPRADGRLDADRAGAAEERRAGGAAGASRPTAGGCQSLHTNGYDEALALPTERSATLALRTQQVLLHESGVAAVPDPFGGSEYVEALTDASSAEARDPDHRDRRARRCGRGIARRMRAPPRAQALFRARACVVKVLDFGLAKFVGADDSSSGHTRTPGVTDVVGGVVVGTPAYMSPEQARGFPVDKRSDIWAFGCLLYEMLTGGLAFAGDTVSDTIAKVLEREPDWRALPARRQSRFDGFCCGASPKIPNSECATLAMRGSRWTRSARRCPTRQTRPRRARAPHRAVRGGCRGLPSSRSLRRSSRCRPDAVPPPSRTLSRRPGQPVHALGRDRGPRPISPDGKFVIFVADHERRFDLWRSQVGTGRLREPRPTCRRSGRWNPPSRLRLFGRRLGDLVLGDGRCARTKTADADDGRRPTPVPESSTDRARLVAGRPAARLHDDPRSSRAAILSL